MNSLLKKKKEKTGRKWMPARLVTFPSLQQSIKKKKTLNPFLSHLKQTQEVNQTRFLSPLVTFRAWLCKQPLSVPVTKPSDRNDLSTDTGAEIYYLLQKHCQIKSLCPTHAKQNWIIVILSKIQNAGLHRLLSFMQPQESGDCLWICLCMAIN